MVSVSKVQCGKELRLLERREGGIQQWQGTPSADGILIKASVINAGAQGAVLLFDKKELFAPTGNPPRTDHTRGQRLTQVHLLGFPLRPGKVL